jgi:hypothetical protein
MAVGVTVRATMRDPFAAARFGKGIVPFSQRGTCRCILLAGSTGLILSG